MCNPLSDIPPLSKIALFLDFDGTLVELQNKADLIELRSGMAEILKKLQTLLGLGPVLISGRDLDDLSSRVPHDLHRIGNHGLRIALPGEVTSPPPPALPQALMHPLEEIIKSHAGSFAEHKTSIVAIHYRAVPDKAESLEAALRALPLGDYGYHLEAGKMIFELKPDGASKGRTLKQVMKDYPDLVPVMFGDDTTDEGAMQAAQELGGMGVKVGSGPTCAKIRIDTVDAVNHILTSWASGERP